MKSGNSRQLEPIQSVKQDDLKDGINEESSWDQIFKDIQSKKKRAGGLMHTQIIKRDAVN